MGEEFEVRNINALCINMSVALWFSLCGRNLRIAGIHRQHLYSACSRGEGFAECRERQETPALNAPFPVGFLC